MKLRILSAQRCNRLALIKPGSLLYSLSGLLACVLCMSVSAAKITVSGLDDVVKGEAFVQVKVDEPVTEVHLQIAGVVNRIERAAPYSLMGDRDNALFPWDTKEHANGEYILKVTATTEDGQEVVDHFSFVIDNPLPRLNGNQVSIMMSKLPSQVYVGQRFTLPTSGLEDGEIVWLHLFDKKWGNVVRDNLQVSDDSITLTIPEATGDRRLQLQYQPGFKKTRLIEVLPAPVLSEPEPETSPNVITGPQPTAEPALEPGVTPVAEPALEPEVAPVAEPVLEPEVTPVAEPVLEPEVAPVVEPTPEPVVAPVAEPVLEPEVAPVAEPVLEPEVAPVNEPALEPEVAPVAEPTPEPVVAPVAEPVLEPEVAPIAEPALEPEVAPVAEPTPEPVVAPVAEPALEPVVAPVAEPALEPEVAPVAEPTPEPVVAPVAEPVLEPEVAPVAEPVLVLEVAPVVETTPEPETTPEAVAVAIDLSGVPSTLKIGQRISVPVQGIAEGETVFFHLFDSEWANVIRANVVVRGGVVELVVPDISGDRILQLQYLRDHKASRRVKVDAPSADPVAILEPSDPTDPVVVEQEPQVQEPAQASDPVVIEVDVPQTVGSGGADPVNTDDKPDPQPVEQTVDVPLATSSSSTTYDDISAGTYGRVIGSTIILSGVDVVKWESDQKVTVLYGTALLGDNLVSAPSRDSVHTDLLAYLGGSLATAVPQVFHETLSGYVILSMEPGTVNLTLWSRAKNATSPDREVDDWKVRIDSIGDPAVLFD